jgi:hypothetical protein
MKIIEKISYKFLKNHPNPTPITAVFHKPFIERSRTHAAALTKDFLEWNFLDCSK